MLKKCQIKVNVFNLIKNPLIKKYSRLFKKAIKHIFYGRKNNIEVNLIFVGEKRIRDINNFYLKKNKITDVISFNWKIDDIITDEELPFGDIYICVKQAQRQAKLFGISLLTEILILVIHGALHLLGYNDDNRDNYIKMSKRTVKELKKLLN